MCCGRRHRPTRTAPTGTMMHLFCGCATENALLKSDTNLRADVIKVAHHGSRTSSIQSFVDATRPSVAVISVGRTSIFGHPHKEVVERWRASGAQVLTTGEK